MDDLSQVSKSSNSSSAATAGGTGNADLPLDSASAGGSGVAYLRALKETDPISAPAPQVTYGNNTYAGAERRRSPRYQCEGSAELRVEDSNVHTWGAVKDISMHGCYVEMMATYPAGTVVHLALEVNGVRVQAEGEVRVNYPFLGMGIVFREIEDRGRLQQMIRASFGLPKSPVQESPALPLPTIVDPKSALDAIIKFFQLKPALLREQFLDLLRQSQESR